MAYIDYELSFLVRNSGKANRTPLDDELDAKKHLLSVGLYGESVSIISNAMRLTTVIRNHTEKYVLKKVGLSYSGFITMWILWVWGDMLTTKLAESSGLANSTITGLLKTLEKRNYCQRIPYSEDGRKIVVHLTNEGRKMMEEIFPSYHKIEDLAVFNLSKKELKATKDGLRNILHTMEELEKIDGKTPL
jgi:DNA-binding MarR family transcriptional regulator